MGLRWTPGPPDPLPLFAALRRLSRPGPLQTTLKLDTAGCVISVRPSTARRPTVDRLSEFYEGTLDPGTTVHTLSDHACIGTAHGRAPGLPGPHLCGPYMLQTGHRRTSERQGSATPPAGQRRPAGLPPPGREFRRSDTVQCSIGGEGTATTGGRLGLRRRIAAGPVSRGRAGTNRKHGRNARQCPVSPSGHWRSYRPRVVSKETSSQKYCMPTAPAGPECHLPVFRLATPSKKAVLPKSGLGGRPLLTERHGARAAFAARVKHDQWHL